jgi:hypothetical protein
VPKVLDQGNGLILERGESDAAGAIIHASCLTMRIAEAARPVAGGCGGG